MFGTWCGYFGNEQMHLSFIMFHKCDHICGTIYLDCFGLITNVIVVAYAIVKRPHDELSICCMKFAYLYNKFSTIVNFLSNFMVSLGNVVMIGCFESYILQCEQRVDVCISSNIQ
jgi:hypothetical protein